MKRPLMMAMTAAVAALAMAPLSLVTPAEAQVDVYIGKQPQQGQVPPSTGPYGDRDRDRDRDGNRYGNYDNRRGQWGDRDRDAIPNRYDQYDNRYRNDYNQDRR
jgi:hypothetical protein